MPCTEAAPPLLDEQRPHLLCLTGGTPFSLGGEATPYSMGLWNKSLTSFTDTAMHIGHASSRTNKDINHTSFTGTSSKLPPFLTLCLDWIQLFMDVAFNKNIHTTVICITMSSFTDICLLDRNTMKQKPTCSSACVSPVLWQKFHQRDFDSPGLSGDPAPLSHHLPESSWSFQPGKRSNQSLLKRWPCWPLAIAALPTSSALQPD